MIQSEIKLRKTQRDFLLAKISTETRFEKGAILSLKLLKEKLDTGLVFGDDELLPKYVELNSVVSLKTSFGFKYGLKLVLPEESDMQSFRLSVLSSLGCAILGNKEGDNVKWFYQGETEYAKIIKVTTMSPAE